MFKIQVAILVITQFFCAQSARAQCVDMPILKSEPSPSSVFQQTCCPIIELRQYKLHPGKRDVLIELFDREFVETQEAVGMSIVGQFRDLDDSNRFVWLRGFSDMPSRARSLEDFYGGPVWKAHRQAANATMIDSTNVLLLRPARPRSGFVVGSNRPSVGANENTSGLVVATIYYSDAPVTENFVDFFDTKLKRVLTNAGASILAYFVTEHSTNTFPKLPVREAENVFVWFSCFRDRAAYNDYLKRVSNSTQSSAEVWEELARRLQKKAEVLKLSPTARSKLRC
jgi:NIPSNAP